MKTNAIGTITNALAHAAGKIVVSVKTDTGKDWGSLRLGLNNPGEFGSRVRVYLNGQEIDRKGIPVTEGVFTGGMMPVECCSLIYKLVNQVTAPSATPVTDKVETKQSAKVDTKPSTKKQPVSTK